MTRLAIICSHPIQYYAPWFRYLAMYTELHLKVFYLWDFGVNEQKDPGFETAFTWDVPLLEGYQYEFVKNTARNPGTSHFLGLMNPSLIQELQSFAPDAILTYGYNYLSLWHVLTERSLQNIPKFLRGDSHLLFGNRGIKEKTKHYLRKKIFGKYAGFLAVGKANREYYLHHEIEAERIFQAPHAIDTERFSPRERLIDLRQKLEIDQENRIILFVGKFEQKKQPLELLQAFQNADLSQCTLLYIGAGELEEQLRAAADRNIIMSSFYNQSEMPDIYALADLIVLPSYGRYETWGMAVHEAMTMGVPALVSSHVGCGPDLIREGKTGWVFPAGDYNELRSQLVKLFSDDVDLEICGSAARARILEKYSYQQTTEGLLEALSTIQ